MLWNEDTCGTMHDPSYIQKEHTPEMTTLFICSRKLVILHPLLLTPSPPPFFYPLTSCRWHWRVCVGHLPQVWDQQKSLHLKSERMLPPAQKKNWSSRFCVCTCVCVYTCTHMCHRVHYILCYPPSPPPTHTQGSPWHSRSRGSPWGRQTWQVNIIKDSCTGLAVPSSPQLPPPPTITPSSFVITGSKSLLIC